MEKKTRHAYPTWKKQYGVLSLHDGISTFKYFADESQTVLKGSVNITSSSKVRIGEQQHLKKNNQIIVYVDANFSFKIALESEDYRDAWLSAFQSLLLDSFDHLTGNENHPSSGNSELRAAEEKETLRELLISTSLYRGGCAVSYECQDRIVCLDPSDITMYDLTLSDKAPLRTARSCPSRNAVPILVMHLHGSLDIPAEVMHIGLDHIIDLRTPDATLRIMFRTASTASAWLHCLVELRNAALDRNRQYQSSGLTRLTTMMPNTVTNGKNELDLDMDLDMKLSVEEEMSPGLAFQQQQEEEEQVQEEEQEQEQEQEEKVSRIPSTSCLSEPPMSIIILVVGTRGDVQPFVYLGMELQRRGHNVRIGTHEEYRDFVVGEGLLFYPLGGDPRKLSEYMVKTKGRLIPDLTNCE